MTGTPEPMSGGVGGQWTLDKLHILPRSQLSLFGDEGYERDSGTEGISKIYKDKLKDLFGQRFMETSKTLMNSMNSPLFEFVFCVGNESGIGPAKRIASHILNARA